MSNKSHSRPFIAQPYANVRRAGRYFYIVRYVFAPLQTGGFEGALHFVPAANSNSGGQDV